MTYRVPYDVELHDYLHELVNSIKDENEDVVAVYVQDIVNLGLNKFMFTLNIYHNYLNRDRIKISYESKFTGE